MGRRRGDVIGELHKLDAIGMAVEEGRSDMQDLGDVGSTRLGIMGLVSLRGSERQRLKGKPTSRGVGERESPQSSAVPSVPEEAEVSKQIQRACPAQSGPTEGQRATVPKAQ